MFREHMFRFAAMLLFYDRNYRKTKSSLHLIIYQPQNFDANNFVSFIVKNGRFYLWRQTINPLTLNLLAPTTVGARINP